MGVFFSAGWAPCVGPVLGAILTLSLNGGSISVGATLLSAYSAGLAVPFLIAALGIGWVSVTLKKYGKLMHYVEIVMGVVLVIIGFALFSGIYEKYAALLSQNVWIDFGI
jgi:cytochrome c-type biogenesis protein